MNNWEASLLDGEAIVLFGFVKTGDVRVVLLDPEPDLSNNDSIDALIVSFLLTATWPLELHELIFLVGYEIDDKGWAKKTVDELSVMVLRSIARLVDKGSVSVVAINDVPASSQGPITLDRIAMVMGELTNCTTQMDNETNKWKKARILCLLTDAMDTLRSI